jgi:hypothetical protein
MRRCTEMQMRWSPSGLKLQFSPAGFELCYSTWASPPVTPLVHNPHDYVDHMFKKP